MRFPKLTLQQVLATLQELPADWQDDVARQLVGQVEGSLAYLRELGRHPNVKDLEEALTRYPGFLDVCRLFLGKGQEPAAHLLCDRLGGRRKSWVQLRKLAAEDPPGMAAALAEIGILEIIGDQLTRQWRLEDILIDRYKMTRGRAIAGQKRGRALEDEVERVLREVGTPFVPRVKFSGKGENAAKCDFAIPSKDHPKIVIEAKGFEATGSKLTDFLGDVLKIGEAKEYHMYFFLVTDGRGWHNRQSDLKKLVEFQNARLIDMIYTVSQLDQLASDVKRILESE